MSVIECRKSWLPVLIFFLSIIIHVILTALKQGKHHLLMDNKMVSS